MKTTADKTTTASATPDKVRGEYKGKQWTKAREKAQAIANNTGAVFYAFPEYDGTIAIEIDYPKSGVYFETFKPETAGARMMRTKQTTTANRTPGKVRGEITLSTGRVLTHERMKNGAQSTTIKGSATGEMTEDEWLEYCDIIASKRTIPAEKPTAPNIQFAGSPEQFHGDTYDPRMSQVTPEGLREDRLIAIGNRYKAHADKLSEALRHLMAITRNDNALQYKEAAQALAAYESEVRQ